MRKQLDKDDPMEDAIQKCKDDMREAMNKINRTPKHNKGIRRTSGGPWKHNKTFEERVAAQDEEIAILKRELAKVCSRDTLEEGELQPSVIEEINTIKEQVRAIKEGEEQHKEMTTTWVDVMTKTTSKR